ncbi:unnamed protein product [Oikopleura dioica]|nr:unnamed protein product [Oikopleura dioica]
MMFNFFGRIAIRRLPAKSQQRFEAQAFLELTDTTVPRESSNPPAHFFPDEIDVQVPSTLNFGDPTSELKIITFEASDLPPGDEAPHEHLDFLRENFGHSQFRDNQWRVISSIIYKRTDQLVIMATGHGKSLCFQYPTLWMNAHVICVSPLISLMQDQVDQLNAKGIPACFLGSAQNQKRIVLANIYNRKYKAIYVCPEWIEKNILQLRRIMSKIPVALIAIDEAHCVSEWGHDFRKAYMGLSSLKQLSPNTPVVALTGTATVNMRDEIIKCLDLSNAQTTVGSFDRPNIFIKVKKKTTMFDDLINSDAILPYKSIIIYCRTKQLSEDVATKLAELKNETKSTFYHAGLSTDDRESIQNEFLRGQTKVIVATIAFGMGIDKADVRRVIHYGIPSSLEAYYQEIGRAGRDGKSSDCIVFFNEQDKFIAEHFIKKTSNPKRKEQLIKGFQDVMNLFSTTTCRREFILDYFGEKIDRSRTDFHVCCDICHRLQDDESKAEIFLHCLVELGDRQGVGKIIKMIRGSNDNTMSNRAKISRYHGKGKHKKPDFWKGISAGLEKECFTARISIPTKMVGTVQYKYQAIGISQAGLGLNYMNSSE